MYKDVQEPESESMDSLNMLGENDVCFQSGTLRICVFQDAPQDTGIQYKDSLQLCFFYGKVYSPNSHNKLRFSASKQRGVKFSMFFQCVFLYCCYV